MLMRARALLAAFTLALVPGCLEDPPAPSAGSDPRAEALAFALSLVESFFARDRDAFVAALDDTLFTLEGEGPFSREEAIATVDEKPFPWGQDVEGTSIADYHATYAPFVLSVEEARAEHAEFARTTWNGWSPDGDDWIFVGNELREGKSQLLWGDILAFGVTSEDGAWAFKAFSG